MKTAVLSAPKSAQAHAADYSVKRRKLALLVIATAFVLDLMDSTILNIALPTIQHTMHASYTALQWMAAGYTLTFALLLITGGRMGDVFGYKKLFTWGLVGFMISSLFTGIAWSPDILIVARLLQGATAALMVPQVLSVVQLLYKPGERVAVNGMLGGLSAIATTLGPIVAGLLIKANIGGLGWRPIFLINIPVGLAALFLGLKYLPEGKSEHAAKIDGIGTLLVTAAIGLLIFPLIQGHELGWPIWTFIMMIASLPMLGLFAWWQQHLSRRNGSPLVIPALFKHRSFNVGLLLSMLIFSAMSSFALTFTLLLQAGYGFSPLHTVLTGIFITVGIMPMAGAVVPKLMPKLGRWTVTLGVIVMALGATLLGLAVTHADGALTTWQFAPLLVIFGAGMGLSFTPLLPYALSQVNPQNAGSASGVANALQQIGGSLGIALVGIVFFGNLISTKMYAQGFGRGTVLALGILAACLLLSLWLPRNIIVQKSEHEVTAK
jgi:EmrB/QacA subfamily drug resistance transporter